MQRVSFLSSGSGYLTKTILDAIEKNVLKNIIPVSIISDKESPSLTLATKYTIKAHLLDFKKFASRRKFSDKILDIFEHEKIDFSFMTFDRILSGKIIKKYENRIINMHPSLLPAFPGYNTIENARTFGATYIGATCHFIDKEIDHGPIINQAILPFNANEDIQKTQKKLYLLRQKLTLEAIYAFTNGLIKINNRTVLIKNANYDSYPLNPSLDILSLNNFLKNYDK